MEQVIPFKKDIQFKTKLSEVTSISLEHTLKPTGNDSVAGEFIISGTYKMSEVSVDEEFTYKLPFDIILDKDYKEESITVDIDDFYYEVIDDEVLRINIEVYIAGDEIINEVETETPPIVEDEEIIDLPSEVLINEEEITNLPTESEEEEMRKEPMLEKIEINEIAMPKATLEDDKTTIFDTFGSSDEKYVSYHVHIVRSEETLEAIVAKYNVSLDELEKYNDLGNITSGTKLIIPNLSE